MASNLTRFDPFTELSRWSPMRTLDDMFRDIAPRGMMQEMQAPTIGVEVSETDKDYTVRAEIPGVK